MRRRQFFALFRLGLVGVVALLPTLIQALSRARLPPEAPPRGVLVALSLLQAALLMGIAVAVGLRLAPRLGLRSYVVESVGGGAPVWPALRRDLPLGCALGAGAMALVVALDFAFRPYMGDAWRRLEQTQVMDPVTTLVAGLFYGGVTEELLLRWGLLSLVAWLGWRFVDRRLDAPPRAGVMWVAILLSAIVFGAGHLPALSMLIATTPVIVTRTVLLNAIAGVVFGWLFWRRSLEAAMVAHATGHVVLFAVRVVAS